MAVAEGFKKRQELYDAGFSSQEVAQWESQTRRELSDAGFSSKEADEYFGIKEPDMSAVKDTIHANLASASRSPASSPEERAKKTPEEIHAEGFLENIGAAFGAGFQQSVTGLLHRGKLPDRVLPEDANMFARIASQVGTLVGDSPFMGVGGILGGAAGAGAGTMVNPGPGTAVGALVGRGAGSFALPAAMRDALVKHYERGDIKDFGDFWERTSSVFLEAIKGGVTGAATVGAGAGMGKLLGPAMIPTAAKTAATAAAEVATMTTVGKALEGQVPNAQDFVDGAILVGGMHATGAAIANIPGKLRSIYAKTGLQPHEVVAEAMTDPVVKQELLSSNVEIPTKFQGAAEAPKAEEIPKAEAVPETPAEPKTAQEKILSRVGEQPEQVAKGYGFNEFYRDYVDRVSPIGDMMKELGDKAKTTADKDPYKSARMAVAWGGKVENFVKDATRDFATLARNGKSLEEIVSPHKDDIPGFKAYLISKRVIELSRRGVETGFDHEAAQEVVASGEAKFEKAAQEFVDYNNRVLKYAKDSGLISEEAFGKMLESNKSYVSFKRVFEDPAEAQGKGKGKLGSLKKIQGSDRMIQDPLQSAIENTAEIIRRAEANRAAVNVVDMALKDPEVSGIEKVPVKMAPVEVSADEVAKFFKEQGIDADAEGFSIFRPMNRSLGKDEIAVFKNGKREVYKLDPDIAEAVKSVDGQPAVTNLFFKIAKGLTAVKKVGLVSMPDFALKNAFRDQLTMGTFSEGGAIPFMDMIRAIGDITGKKQAYYDWHAAGGSNASFLELKEHYFDNPVFQINKEAGNFLDKTWNIVKKPVEFLAVGSQIIEEASRLAEYKRVVKGDAAGPQMFQAGYSSREVTVDFQRMGAKVAAFNAITAFQNVQIQGLDRTVRAIRDNPKETLTKAAMFITAPSVLLWYANHDDPRWKEIPNWQKDLFWIFMTKDQIYRVPKPQELGILFGSGAERALDAFFTDNPNAYKEFGKTIGGVLTPSMIPDVISTPMEHYFNKSFFTGGPIVPKAMEKILPEYQYTEYTTESAKLLGKFVAAVPGGKELSIASPSVIDNYVRSWSGTLGTYILQLADQALIKSGAVPDPVKPASTLSDIPFIKAFAVRYPSASAQSIQDFYDRHEENKKVVDTIRYLAKTGDFDNMQKELALAENQPKLIALDGMKDALSNQMKFIHMVAKNKDMKPDEKRQIIDGAYYTMIQVAGQGNQLFDEIEKSLKSKR